MSDDFDLSAFVADHPTLSWALEECDESEIPTISTTATTGTTVITVIKKPSPSGQSGRDDEEEQEEALAPTMSPPGAARVLCSPSVTPESEETSSDSLMRILLEPPPSKGVLEPPQLESSSSTSLTPSPKDGVPSPQTQELMETAFIGRTPMRPSKRRHESTYVPEETSTPPELGLGDLDAKSALFLAKHFSPPKPQRYRSTAIDPYAVGIATMHEVLRDGARLTKMLHRDERALGQRKKLSCVCNIPKHPPWWPQDRIQDVHNYSFLLDCQNLAMSEDATVVAANRSKSVVIYNVPMEYNNPIKLKAEQVLRFVDVEIGFGDQTCSNLFYYVQPHHRKILLVVSYGRVVGIVVAEKILVAHRILRESASFMELEVNPVRVRVGINRLWVHISMRRHHLATLLCRLIGKTFYEKETLRNEDFAFNNNSDAMVLFAKVFLKNIRPPLYCRLK